jgi:hypothetical protein
MIENRRTTELKIHRLPHAHKLAVYLIYSSIPFDYEPWPDDISLFLVPEEHKYRVAGFLETL